MYQKDPDAAPDSDFTPGELSLLVSGNTGRLLDPRRTPIGLVAIEPEIAVFELEVTAFEDQGARWRLPFEDVVKFQFANGSDRLRSETLELYEQAVSRYDRPLSIPADAGAAATTLDRIAERVDDADKWLRQKSRFFAAERSLPTDAREGDPRLQSDMDRFLDSFDLVDLERELTETYVSNPHSGEVLKGHRIVIAEMGLAPFEGKIVRDPSILAGSRDRTRRREHILARLGFVRAMFGLAGVEHVVLYRSMSFEGAPRGRNDETFVSTTFCREIATTWFDSDVDRRSVIMMRQPVPVERVFMTYLETAAMNRHFREAEAVLLLDPDSALF